MARPAVSARALAVARGDEPADLLIRGGRILSVSARRWIDESLAIADGCIVGHNVLLHDCSIGSRTLVGMGSTLAPGTLVGDDVLVAAGSSTTAGQVLEGGWLWAGRPALPVVRLDERKTAMIGRSADVYRGYARDFAIDQAAATRTP